MSIDLDDETYPNIAACERSRNAVFHNLLQSVHGNYPATGPEEPNRVLSRYLEPVVKELDDRTRAVEEYVADLGGDPGSVALAPDVYIQAVDSLKHLRERVNFYLNAVEQVKNRSDMAQRQALGEFVFLPILGGARHEVVWDENSPWIETVSDFCEPVIIARNVKYVHEELTGWDDRIRNLFQSVGEVFGDAWVWTKETGKQVLRGAKNLATLAPIALGIVLLVGLANSVGNKGGGARKAA